MPKKAVCLFSGGLDSTTALYSALKSGYEPIALTIQYGQLHEKETEFAKLTASKLGIKHFVVPITMPWGGSSLIDRSISMPKGRALAEMEKDIPNTYVPARNSIFLAFAVSCAETVGAQAVFIGANALDYSGYPDCRPEFFKSFEDVIAKGTKAGTLGKKIEIKAPLLHLSKKEIIELGKTLSVPYQNTWSCYQDGEKPCGVCDSCLLRAKGFHEAKLKDPALS